MTVYAITDTKNGRTGIAPTYLQTTPFVPWNIRSVELLFLGSERSKNFRSYETVVHDMYTRRRLHVKLRSIISYWYLTLLRQHRAAGRSVAKIQ